ncbi:MAG: ribbon-helix-helix domain-containing protein [Microthrixaceae bacterium]
MIRTQISMTEEQAEKLRRLAALRQRSQAALMREALDALLADSENTRTASARSVIGRYGSGNSDTAERHDEALDEAFSR